ncbi:hypothetical protein ABB37_07670 [Leptomonas pyrrhocoris]|uniref:Uncharacterized protein n=1 Tax=Leptomonas pyrrhocoris TaxID=157538 RepID=A0A0N0VDZ0_LEPPY|nr:hypothetical protein ABB37_10114 [Leptomonas pyrrhocoris]XP_015651552.1 hypothetical protein ABB37_10114 [Leptomonas pyrrhocoris]XP_015655317.1 hypothetical protein ABB37_07670 [Leptomonas pyrrhocoris]KPA73112.1 hypothetical protein ABB37_10114 [Leptomonas pyrrhocoris]KPA73113.1 hypothetical protein ABB37_10114 [Leptomonas pyrrhocoris]KPA76878.1 hypothetical protein ABB37_07670 [Leptomonas pyrrhocoris]|eukprot:XP_015651551.1 hypothetical protein ABB37_10114 [Leptomonas pyrrhocoris]
MIIKEHKKAFEQSKAVYESALLAFKGVDGFDVYNCSVPFKYKGRRHIYGRVEKREIWAASHVRLFEETGKDEFTAVPEFSIELEDPYIQNIKNEMIFGGTHVRKDGEAVLSYFGYFYRGTPTELNYFTTGPDFMKDIRVLQLHDGRLGIFSRVRTKVEVYVGFATVDSIDHLTTAAIAGAKPIDFIRPGMWGGVNQPYLLTSGKVGCIGHIAYNDKKPNGDPLSVYVNCAFVFDPVTRAMENEKVIGTKSCYPSCPAKKPNLEDCVFASGIVMREDGKCDLYSGLGDTGEGRITIDYPFEGYGQIVGHLEY